MVEAIQHQSAGSPPRELKDRITVRRGTEARNIAKAAAARKLLMLTAITHHRFGSPIWGKDEVRKLQLELTEIDMLTTQAAAGHATGRTRRLQPQLTEPVDSGWPQCQQVPL